MAVEKFSQTLVDPGTYWHSIDVETSGLSKNAHEVAEIAIITCKNTKIVDIYHSFFSVKEMSPEASAVNGLNLYQLAGWPSFKSPEIVNLLRSKIKYKIYAHNAQFDLGFLNVAGIIQGSHPYLCTRELAKKEGIYVNNKLTTITQHLGIPHNAHSALGDALALFHLITLKGWQIL